MASKKKKVYRVELDQKWTTEYIIRAESSAEAKKEAFRRFSARLPKKCFKVWIDKI